MRFIRVLSRIALVNEKEGNIGCCRENTPLEKSRSLAEVV